MAKITSVSKGAGTRVFCGIGNSTHDSWAFAVPLYNPTGSNTGWCADSRGIVKEVALDFSTGSTDSVGGRSTYAQCP